MERIFEQYTEETQDLRRISFSLCEWMKSWDIQIVLETHNFEKESSNVVWIEFQWPGSVGKPNYKTYQTLWKFVNEDNFPKKTTTHKKLSGIAKEVCIVWDFKQRTCYLKLSKTTEDIVTLFVKWGGILNEPTNKSDSEGSLSLLTNQTRDLYKGELSKTILITQDELMRMFKLMESMEADMEKYGEDLQPVIM